MRSHRIVTAASIATLATCLALNIAAAQPERPASPGGGQPGDRQPERRGGERRPGGEAPNVEASMKGMNRAVNALKESIGDASKKEANLKLIGDAQRGCINAKSGTPRKIADLKDDAAKAKASESFRRQLMAVARKLLDIEQQILEGKNADAKAALDEVVKMGEKGHEEFGVD